MEVDPVVTYSAVSPRLGRGLWASISVAFVATAVLFSLISSVGAPTASQSGTATMPGGASPALTDLAATRPGREVEVIAQFQPGVEPAQARGLVRKAGGRVTGDLHVINGLAASMSASQAHRLAARDGVRSVSLNAQTKPQSIDASALETSYNQSIRSDDVWSRPATGRGIGVAVIDTGIAAALPDFRVSDTNHGSRVVATATVIAHQGDQLARDAGRQGSLTGVDVLDRAHDLRGRRVLQKEPGRTRP